MNAEAVKTSVAEVVAFRRASALGDPEGARWECSQCGEPHANFNSHVEHGLCEACREESFAAARKSRDCCRCGGRLLFFTPHGSREGQTNRYLVCCGCALVIVTDPADRVAGTNKEYTPRKMPALEE